MYLCKRCVERRLVDRKLVGGRESIGFCKLCIERGDRGIYYLTWVEDKRREATNGRGTELCQVCDGAQSAPIKIPGKG